MTRVELWQATLGELELLVSKANFTTWFRNTFIMEMNDDYIVVAVPNAFTKAWLENKYHVHIIKAVQRLTNQQINQISYQVIAASPLLTAQEGAVVLDKKSVTGGSTETPTINVFGLNSKYTFNRFIVGKSTELAHAACLAVAASLGQAYNPLFLYGGVGLGKTHLLQAIGAQVLSENPQARVVFTTCEKFTNDFVQAIRGGALEAFKKNYREVDLLLVDDVQFLANKEQTQEEFFHTFNSLHGAGKQIVLTSDRPPKAIPAIASRLMSRFEWGMIADVGKPDFETRVAILEARANEKNFPLGIEALKCVAEIVPNNVRELEGALNKLFAYYQLNRVVPNLDLIKSLLSSLTQNSINQGGLTAKKVVQVVSVYFDISINDLVGSSRRKELVVPRQIAMFLLREECGSSFPSIGHELGGRDHTTAMHACSKIKKELLKNNKLRGDVEQIKMHLGGNGSG